MAAELYVKEVEKSPENDEASEVIEEGSFVVAEVGGGLHNADPSSDSFVDGIVPHRERGPHLPEHEWDYSAVQYDSGEYPVPYYVLEDGMKLHPETPSDDTVTAPSIDRWTVVGLVTLGGEQVVVEEGYTHDTTTYNRSNSNFLPLGTALEPASEYGEKFHVKVQSRLLESR